MAYLGRMYNRGKIQSEKVLISSSAIRLHQFTVYQRERQVLIEVFVSGK